MTPDEIAYRVRVVGRTLHVSAYVLLMLLEDSPELRRHLAELLREGDVPVFIQLARLGARIDRDLVGALIRDEDIDELLASYARVKIRLPGRMLRQLTALEEHGSPIVSAAAERLATRVRLAMLGL